MRLRTRVTLYLNGLLLVTVVLIAGLTLFTTVRSLRARARLNALGTASLLASAAASVESGSRDPAFVERLVEDAVNTGHLEAVFVVGPEGDLQSPKRDGLVRDFYLNKLDLMAEETRTKLRSAARFRGNSVEASVPLAGFGGRAGALICRLDTRRLDEAISSSLRDIVVLSVAGLLAGAFISGILAKRVSGPVRKLAEAARAVGSGRLDHRVPVESDDEVGMLAESFNKMAGSLQAYTEELARTTAEKEALRREMDIAAEIQRSMLPESCPGIDGFDVAAETIPAHDVGGDFYDFIPLPDGRWGVVIADVSGKGVPAALLMALSRSLIRAFSRSHPSILRALELANDFLLKDTRSGMFVTCFFAVIEPARRRLTYVNAGHNPPVVTRTGGPVVLLRASGTPLGILDQSGLAEETCELAAGDIVLLYTDGITEAVDAYGEPFGAPRLEEVVKNSCRLGAAEICGRLLTAVRTFAGDQPQFDDVTTVVLKVL